MPPIHHRKTTKKPQNKFGFKRTLFNEFHGKHSTEKTEKIEKKSKLTSS